MVRIAVVCGWDGVDVVVPYMPYHNDGAVQAKMDEEDYYYSLHYHQSCEFCVSVITSNTTLLLHSSHTYVNAKLRMCLYSTLQT